MLPDHELFDEALAWARKFATKAPIALQEIKRVTHRGGDPEAGIEAEKQGFATVFGTEDAKEGIGAFLGRRQASFKGK